MFLTDQDELVFAYLDTLIFLVLYSLLQALLFLLFKLLCLTEGPYFIRTYAYI